MTNEEIFVTLMAASTGVMVVSLILTILIVVARWKIFVKAGEAGWKSIIPFYSDYILFKICWETKYFGIMIGLTVLYGVFAAMGIGIGATIALLVALVISLMMYHKLSLSFGKGLGFTVGLILLNTIFILILGFGSAEYQGPAK